jgi:tetratricopeptide (TPR) repeat protein
MKKAQNKEISINANHSTKKKKKSKNKFNKSKNKKLIKMSTIINIYNKGVKFSDQNYFTETLDKLAVVLKNKPNCALAHYYRSMCLFNLNKFDLANDSINIALNLNHRDVDFKIMKAHILQCTGKVEESIEIYDNILTTQPRNDIALVGKSEAVLKLNKINLAKNFMKKAIEINPQCANYHNNLGYILTKLEDYESINSYSKAIKLNSFHLDSYFNKTQDLIKLKKYHEALTCLNFAIQKFPNEGLLFFERGYTLYLLDKDEDAILEFEQSIRLNYQVAESYNYIGDCYFYLKDFKRALNYFKKSLELDINNPEYIFDVAETYFELGNYEESENICNGLQKKVIFNENLKSDIESLMSNIKNKKQSSKNKIIFPDHGDKFFYKNQVQIFNETEAIIEETYENINAIMDYETEYSFQDS